MASMVTAEDGLPEARGHSGCADTQPVILPLLHPQCMAHPQLRTPEPMPMGGFNPGQGGPSSEGTQLWRALKPRGQPRARDHRRWVRLNASTPSSPISDPGQSHRTSPMFQPRWVTQSLTTKRDHSQVSQRAGDYVSPSHPPSFLAKKEEFINICRKGNVTSSHCLLGSPSYCLTLILYIAS